MQILIGLLGIVVLIVIAVLLSTNRKAINLRTVGLALILQICIAALVLYVPLGQKVLGGMSFGVAKLITYCDAGIGFLFGGLVSDKMFELFGNSGFVFALRVLPLIVFFSSLIAILYYVGVMQFIIRVLGGALNKLLRTSPTESMASVSNIFLGLSEAPLAVKPYISRMTQSELFAILACGAASIAGSVLAGYAQLGIPLEYLIAASFMAAPGGLLFAKLMVPETEKVNPNEKIEVSSDDEKPANVIDAAASGASSGMHLALNVGAMLLAFIALLALINGILGGVGGWFGMENLSLELILGWICAPIAFIIGVPWNEAIVAGSFIGQKFVLNEFVAYMSFSEYLKPDAVQNGLMALSDNTKVIISFALCGFANIGSIAILIGGVGGMAPSRRKDIARFGFKAMIAGSLSNLMSATIAGIFFAISAM